MPTFETAAERRARLHEQAGRAHRYAAKRVLDDLGWSATAREVGDEVRRRFRRLTEAGVTMVVSEARRMQQDPRLRTEAMALRKETTKATRKALRKLLADRPELTNDQAWHRLTEAGVKLCARSTFDSHHMPEIRKELGIDAKALQFRSSAAPVSRDDQEEEGDTPDLGRWRRHVGSEKPGSRIVEESTKPRADAAEPVCADSEQESHTPVIDRLHDEIRRTEEQLRRLRVALEVVEGLEGERAA